MKQTQRIQRAKLLFDQEMNISKYLMCTDNLILCRGSIMHRSFFQYKLHKFIGKKKRFITINSDRSTFGSNKLDVLDIRNKLQSFPFLQFVHI
jgi:hypothetical protein